MTRRLPVRRLFYRHSRGAGLILVIAVCFLVSLLTGIMYTRYILDRRSLKSTIRDVQNRYTAEAAIKKVFYYLKADPAKGPQWRTGTLWTDTLIRDRVFQSITDEVELSVVDDAGYLRITGKCRNRTVRVRCAGLLPDSLAKTLVLVSAKPLILSSGSRIQGDVRVNLEPRFQGGSIEGVIETNPSLNLPQTNFKTFHDAVKFYRWLLATPNAFDKELFSPQHFAPNNPVPSRKIFVNDAVLIEHRALDSAWSVGADLVIAATAEMQVSGNAAMTGSTLLAIGPVRILDRARLTDCRIFSESAVEIADQTEVSGIIIAPAVMVAGDAQIIDPSIVYTGLPFSQGEIAIRNRALVQACIINTGDGKSFKIETEPGTSVEGLLYSLAPITHRGGFSGYLYGRAFYEPQAGSDTVNTNILSGRITSFPTETRYAVPVCFPQIAEYIPIQWQEY